ncbi:hypothetical protein M413DRAFT_249915 [Hebeloma cylindrosporum]|uniref:Uncharacterized protein n=1 Tax=Hebeloma cylindrosporum TaxID=76867 RepID=A0A0C2XJS1_HEBCY|nr:hypothetical protein M413DRAFT_249915 [Hebeloma cylindrosporum h7]
MKQSKAMRKERKPRGTKKVKDGGSEASEPMVEDGAQAQDGSEGADVQGSPTEGVTDDKEPKPKGRPKVYSCTKEGCYNLLVPTQRWRTCDECRMIERKRQLQVRADQKAAESVYWKGISERMSAEKKAEAATGTSTAAAGGGSSDAQAHVQGADNTSSMDVDPDPDAEGESEHFGAEEHVYSLVNDQAAPAATPVQLPTPPTTGTTTLYGPTTSTGNGFSKFFVQLPPAPPPVRKATSEELLKLSDTLTSRVYRPKSTPSAIEVDPSKPPDPANPTNETTEAQSSNLTSTEVSDKSLPTATVPTSAPFVYDGTARRSEKSDAQTTSSSSKGKRKHKSSSQSTQSASAGPSTSFVPPMTGPANSYTMPYAYPPSYSYYPYYMPPYSYPPPALGSDPTKQSYLPPMISSTGPLPPTSYYPYPYAPPSYGYNAPPPAYPYLPPRYTIPPYGQTSGQQPYPGPTSSSGPGYSYYPPPPPPPLPPPAPTPASAPAPAPAQPPPPKPKPKETEEPKGPTTFSFHHYKLGQSGGPQEPRKRLKADPNYLEKFKAHTSVIKMSLMPASGENTALSESTQRDAPRPDLAALQSTQQNLPAATMEPAGEASTSAAPAMRPCATKTCSRSIPAENHGTICEKCKLRFKKHQAKAKVKYKLEPRKFLKVKSSEGSTQSGV